MVLLFCFIGYIIIVCQTPPLLEDLYWDAIRVSLANDIDPSTLSTYKVDLDD
jgi:hypothetical protein